MSKLVPVQQKVANVRAFLEKAKPQIAVALPKHMTPDRMLRVALTSILQNPKLLDCDQASLGGALVTCAQLGLEPDPLLGQAYLVPFTNRRRGVIEVVVIAGYRGLMKLARNSGEIATFDAHAVHAKDRFTYEYGLTPVLRHTPCQEPGDPGAETHYYAVATMKQGGGQFIVMTKGEVEIHRDRYATNLKDDSAWKTDFKAMALKTCIRQLSKFLPASPELQRAAMLDEHAEAGIPQDLGAMLDLPETTPANGDLPASKLDQFVDEIEKQRNGNNGNGHGAEVPPGSASPVGQGAQEQPAAPTTQTTSEAIVNEAAERDALVAKVKDLVEAIRLDPNYLARRQEHHWGRPGWEHATLDGLSALFDEIVARRGKGGK